MASFLNRFRKGSTYYPTFEETNNPNSYDLKEYPPMPAVENTNKADKCLYTVGRSENGNTVLRLQSDDNCGAMILTMNSPAVRQLIRMLEATIITEEDNESE